MTLDKITKFLIVVIVIILLTTGLVMMDSHTPVATVQFQISDSVKVKVSIYDEKNGFFSNFIEKLKVLIENLKPYL